MFSFLKLEHDGVSWFYWWWNFVTLSSLRNEDGKWNLITCESICCEKDRCVNYWTDNNFQKLIPTLDIFPARLTVFMCKCSTMKNISDSSFCRLKMWVASKFFTSSLSTSHSMLILQSNMKSKIKDLPVRTFLNHALLN